MPPVDSGAVAATFDPDRLAARIAGQIARMQPTQRPGTRTRLLNLIGSRDEDIDAPARQAVLERLATSRVLSIDSRGSITYPDGSAPSTAQRQLR